MTFPEPQTDFEERLPESSFEPFPQPRRWLWLLLAAILLFGGGTIIVWRLVNPQNQGAALNNAQSSGVRVKLAPVQVGIIEESSDFIANLESQRSVKLQPKIEGQVTQIFVREGDKVAQGTPIIQVDPRRQQPAASGLNAVTQADTAQLKDAQATLQSLQADRLSKQCPIEPGKL